MIIVVEGPDGVGKTLQSRRLATRLRAEWMAFPDRSTPIGKLIDGWLKRKWWADYRGELQLGDDPTHLLNALVFQALQLANRAEHLAKLRDAAMPGGAIVLDRYWQSGYAYGKLDGLDPDWLISAHSGLPQATHNVLIDAPAHVIAERMRARGRPPEVYEREDAIARLRESYRELWEWRGWPVVDGDAPEDEVARRVWAAVTA